MRVIAIVELPREEDSLLRTALLGAAYFASRGGPVAVLAPTDARDTLDRGLDPLVASEWRVHGVLYGEACDAWVWHAAGPRTLVVASSPTARGRALAVGATCVEPRQGVSALQSLAAHATSGAGGGSHPIASRTGASEPPPRVAPPSASAVS